MTNMINGRSIYSTMAVLLVYALQSDLYNMGAFLHPPHTFSCAILLGNLHIYSAILIYEKTLDKIQGDRCMSVRMKIGLEGFFHFIPGPKVSVDTFVSLESSTI